MVAQLDDGLVGDWQGKGDGEMSKEDDINAINQDMAGGIINAHANLIREATYKLIDAIAVESSSKLNSASWKASASSVVPFVSLMNENADWCERDDCERAHLKSQPCGPMDRLVDGLTVRECLGRYTAWQRTRDKQSGGNTVYWVDGARMVRPWDMTHEQVTAARLAWSAELKRKQQEAEEKERRIVVVDDDRWEE